MHHTHSSSAHSLVRGRCHPSVVEGKQHVDFINSLTPAERLDNKLNYAHLSLSLSPCLCASALSRGQSLVLSNKWISEIKRKTPRNPQIQVQSSGPLTSGKQYLRACYHHRLGSSCECHWTFYCCNTAVHGGQFEQDYETDYAPPPILNVWLLTVSSATITMCT